MKGDVMNDYQIVKADREWTETWRDFWIGTLCMVATISGTIALIFTLMQLLALK